MLLGPIITRARVRSALSQADLAVAVGLSQSHISRLEDDLVGCSTEALACIAARLELDLGDVLRAAAETAAARRRPVEPEAA